MAERRVPQSSEVHPGPGFRIRREFERPPPEIAAALATFETPTISDATNRLYTMRTDIRPLSDAGLPLSGPACTVKVYPGDNLMVHAALEVARPGDVVVVDGGGSRMHALFGDMIANKAKHRGLAGFVIDGLVRDLDGIRATGLPVFALGTCPTGPLHRGPGEINYPIQCGGVVVQAGDIVVADRNGVTVVSREIAADVAARLASRREEARAYEEAVRRGKFSNEWVWKRLESDGCAID